MIDFNLSLSDLVLIPSFAKAFGENDKSTIKKILHDNGMETSEGWEEVVCTHRNLQGKIVNCLRFESSERQDDVWLKNPACSFDNKIDACNDHTFRAELKTMGKSYNNSDHVISNMKGGVEEL